MLWKELYIEHVGTLGGFGWWLGAALTFALGAGSIVALVIITWDFLSGGDLSWVRTVQGILRTVIGGSGRFIEWVIAWAVGLRAAVAIASERERGTWDAILASPLEASEIIGGKLWGSLFALRWLFAAAALAWTTAVAVDAITPENYIDWVVSTLITGAFMAVVGLRASLSSATATRSMAVTIGAWLVAQAAFTAIAAILVGVVFTLIIVFSGAAYGPAPLIASFIPRILLAALWIVAKNVSFLVATFVLAAYTKVLFDRLAGRRVGGRAAVTAERMLFGDPIASFPARGGPDALAASATTAEHATETSLPSVSANP